MADITVRMALPSDWLRIVELSMQHCRNANVPTQRVPDMTHAVWAVAERKGIIISAIALIDQPDNSSQIILLWNPGKYETRGSAMLTHKAIEAASMLGRVKMWFLTTPQAPRTAVKTFGRFGFYPAGGNGTLVRFERQLGSTVCV